MCFTCGGGHCEQCLNNGLCLIDSNACPRDDDPRRKDRGYCSRCGYDDLCSKERSRGNVCNGCGNDDFCPTCDNRRRQGDYRGLAATCRQAYRESRHLFYEKQVFVMDWSDVAAFAADTRPQNLALIEHLTTDNLMLTTPARPGKSKPYRLQALEPFKGLKGLHVMAVKERKKRRRRGIPLDSTGRLYRDFATALVAYSRDLNSLQTIEIASTISRAEIPGFPRCHLDFDDIPDWTYSVEIKLRSRGEPSVIETLQKVHGPHLSQIEKVRRRHEQ